MEAPIKITEAPQGQRSPFSLWVLKATIHIRTEEEVKTQEQTLRHVGRSPFKALSAFFRHLSSHMWNGYIYRVEIFSIEWVAEVETWDRD